MAMLAEFRKKYPQYDDMNDEQLASALHRKFYSDMPVEEFMSKAGIAPKQDERPWYSKLGAAADDMVRIGANAMTFGYADKLAGALGGEGVEAERAKTGAARERAGSASYAADIGGGLATGMGLANSGVTAMRLVPQGMKGLAGLGARTGAMAVDGAAYGALSATGNDTDVTEGAAIGAIAGGLGNVAGEGIAKGISAASAPFKTQPTVPTIEDIIAKRNSAYKASEDAGVILRPEVAQSLKGKLEGDLAEFGYLPANQPRVKAVLDEIDRISGDNFTLKGLDQVRKQAGAAYDPTNPSSNNITSKIARRIDEAAGNVRPEDVLTGDAKFGVEKLVEARGLNRQSAKLNVVAEALTKAQRNADSTGSGGNINNAIKQQFKAILNSKSKSRGFTPDEIAAMEDIVAGNGTQDALRLLGKLAPQGNGLMMAIQGAGVATNPAVAIPAAIGGSVAKALADKGTKDSAGDLARIIAAGGKRSDAFAPDNAIERLAKSKREAIARALMPALYGSPVWTWGE